MNRADLQRLSRLRLQEARALFESGFYSGAYYLAGYAIECAIKACIAKATQRYDFPDKERVNRSYAHNPRELLRVAGLEELLNTACAQNPRLLANWIIVRDWSEQSRYRNSTHGDANAMIVAVSDRRNGVLPWLIRQW